MCEVVILLYDDCSINDGAIESSSDNDTGIDNADIASIDLNLRIRGYNEKNAALKEQLLQAEDVINGLQKEVKSLQASV